MEVGMGSNCWSWGVHSFPRDSPCSRRAVLVTELAALQLAPAASDGPTDQRGETLRSLSLLSVRWVYQKGEEISRCQGSYQERKG